MPRSRPFVRVLGPVDVLAPAGAHTVHGRQQQAVLGTLVIGFGHAVPVDHLVWAVWGDDPPGSAQSTLQSYVSQLRHPLGHDAIRVAGRTYELRMEAVDVDAREFEMLARRADTEREHPETRLASCRDALALWRGRPFGDLADDEPFRLEAYRLDELRVATLQLALECELALGNHEFAVSELEALVCEHPYRERLWHLLVDALVVSDRRVEALRACARLRDVLAEAGLSPGAWLIEAERSIVTDSDGS